MTNRVPRPGLIAVIAVFGLVSCADDTQPPAAAGETTRQVAEGQASEGNRVQLLGCRQPVNDRVHFAIGQSRLAVPQQAIRNISPAAAEPGATPEQISAQLNDMLGDGLGCPETPLAANAVIIENAVTNPLLGGRIAILRRPPPETINRFTAITRQLQQSRPEDSCRRASQDLLACFGTERNAAVTNEVMYLVTTDPQQNLSTGGPLAARCVLEGQRVVRCGVVDVLQGGVAIDATLKGGEYSTQSLRQARDAAVSEVSRLQL